MTTSYEEWSSAIGDEDIVRPVDAALDLVEFDAGNMFPDMMSSCSGRRQVYQDAVDSGSEIDPGDEVRGLETILEETSDDIQSDDSDCSRSGPASWAWSQDSEDVHTVAGVKTHDLIDTGGRFKEVLDCPSVSNQATSGDEAFSDRLFSGFASSLSSQLPSLDCTFNTSATKYPFSDQGAVGEADDVGKSLDIWQQQLKRPTDLPLVKRSSSDALGSASSSGSWQRKGEWQTFSDDESASHCDRVETRFDNCRDSQMCDASVKRGLNPVEWESDNAVDFDNLDRRIETLTFDFEEEERRSMEFSRSLCPGDRRSVVQALSSLDVGMKRYHSFCDLSQIDSDSVEMVDGKRVQGFQDGGASPTSSKSSESSSEDQISRRRPRVLNAMKNSVENLSEDSGYGDHTSPPQPSDDDVSPGITPNPPVDVKAPHFLGPPDQVSLDRSADGHQEHRSVEAVNRTVISALVQSTFRDHLMWESKSLKRASGSRFSQSTPDLSPGGHRRRRLMGMMWRDAVRRQRLYVDALISDVSDVCISTEGDAVFQRSSERLSSGISCVVQSVGDDGAAAVCRPLPAPRMSEQLRVPAVYQNVPVGAHVAAEHRATLSPSRVTASGVHENSYLLEESLVAGVADSTRPAAGRVISRDMDLTQSNPDLFRWPGINVRRLLKSETDADAGNESDEPRVLHVDDEMQFVSMYRSSAGRPKPLDLRLAEEFILLEGVDECCTEAYVIDGGGDERDGSEKRQDNDGVVGFTGTASGGLWRQADCSIVDGTDTHGSPTGVVGQEVRVCELEDDELVTIGGFQQEVAMRGDSPSVVASSDGEKSLDFMGDAAGLVLCADSAPHEEQSVRSMRSCNSFKPTANGNRSNYVKKADSTSCDDTGDGDLHSSGSSQSEVCVEINSRALGQSYSVVSSGESAAFEPTPTIVNCGKINGIANLGKTSGIHKVRRERPPPPPPRVSSGIKAVGSSVPVVNDAVCNDRKSADCPNVTANVPSDVSRAQHDTKCEENPTSCRVIPQENAAHCVLLTIRSRDSSPVVDGCRELDGAESNKSALPGITACHQNGTGKFKPALPPKPDALVKLRPPTRPIVSRPVIKTVDSVSAAKSDQQRQSLTIDDGLSSADSGRNVCVTSDFCSTDQRGKQTALSVSSSSGGDLCTKPSSESSAAVAAMSPTSAASLTSNTDSWRCYPLKYGADLGHARWLSRSLYGLDRSVDAADRREVVPPPLLPDVRRRGDSGAVSAADRVEAALQRFTRRAREDRQRLARSTPDLSLMEAATRSLASSGARRSDGSDAAVGPPATPAEEQVIDRDRGSHQSTSHSVSVLVTAEGGDAAGCGGQRDTTSSAAADAVDSCGAGGAGSRERYARRRAAALARARSRTALEAQQQQQLPHRETDLDSVFRDLNRSIEEARSGRLKAKSLADLATGSAAGGLAGGTMSGFQGAPHDSRAKSMEFLMGEANKAATQAPENVLLQQSGRHMSEHELRFQRSLRNLNVPDWYKRSTRTDASGILRRDFGSGSITGGWSGLNSKSNSKESLQSSRCTTPSSSQQPKLAAVAGVTTAGGRSGRLYEWRQGASSAAAGRPASSRDSVASSVSAGAGGMTVGAGPVSPAASDRGYYGATHRFGSSSSGGQSPVTGAGRPGGLYLGWRSQERLASSFSHAGYQTPSERLASSMSRMRSEGRLTATAPASRAHSRLSLPRAPPELDVHTSIRAVTSAIVDYFDSGPAGGSGAGSSAADVTRGSSPRRRRRSGAASPAPLPSWVETAFVGSKPVDEPPTPEATKSVLSVSAAPTPKPPVSLLNGDATPAPALPPTVVSATASMAGELIQV